jgi:hypothetical protein
MIRAVLEESSAARRAQTRAITGDRNTKLEIWQLADSLITSPPSAHFTMTSIQKVGINPGSRYNTPLALYAYPVTDHTVDQLMGVFQTAGEAHAAAGSSPAEISKIEANAAKSAKYDEEEAQFFAQFPLNEIYHKLPFVADAPFINFFRLQPDGVFYTSIGMSQGQYDAGMAHLTAYTAQNDVGTDKRYGTPEEAMHLLQQHGVPSGPVQTAPELIEDPHLKARETFIEIDHPVVGKRLYPNVNLLRLTGTPAGPSVRAPLAGEHTDVICRDLLGLSDEEIARLREAKVIGY